MRFPLTLLFICLACTSGRAQTERVNYRNWTVSTERKDKIALVIGNSTYGGKLDLAEPANDAQTMAQALQLQGYDVELGYNLDADALEAAVAQFATRFASYQEGIVYYAGHGIEIGTDNFLVPIGADFTDYAGAKAQCYNVDKIFNRINDPSKPKLVILDACRDNPFNDPSFRDATFQIDFTEKDVAQLRNASIVFSTAKTTAVLDKNIFTEAFAQQIRIGGCLDGILRRLVVAVQEDNDEQLIDRAGILVRQICFGTVEGKAPAVTDTDGDTVTDDQDACVLVPGPEACSGCPMMPTIDWRKRIDAPGTRSYFYEPEVARLTRINSPIAKARLGYLYRTGKGVAKDLIKAKALFAEALGSDGFAEYNLGVLAEEQDSSPSGQRAAWNFYQAGAKLNDPYAWHNLGVIQYYYKKSKLAHQEALQSFSQAAEAGLGSSCTALGEMYLKDPYIDTDLELAQKYFSRGIELGNPEAMINLGQMYANGQGVERNLAEAEAYFREAIDTDYLPAYNWLANLYYHEYGAMADIKEAATYFRYAAEKGDPVAQYNLGNMYWDGEGVQKSKSTARMWYRKAADQGLPEATAKLKED